MRRLAAFWLICAAAGFALVAGLAVALGLAIDKQATTSVALSADPLSTPAPPTRTPPSSHQISHRRLGD